MEAYQIRGKKVEFKFSVPTKENGDIAEDFDFSKKPAVATCGIEDLFPDFSLFDFQVFVKTVFAILRAKAALQRMDYLQVITIEGKEVWCIDNGCDICLLNKDEY